MHGKRISYPVMNQSSTIKRQQKKFHLPVIGHFADRSVEFKSIVDAEKATNIPYQMIFEACIGKIFKAKNIIFEYKKGNHYIKYKAFYINAAEKMKKADAHSAHGAPTHGGHAAEGHASHPHK